MTEFVFTYHGGQKPNSPEEGAESIKAWESWAQGLGEALVNPGHMATDTTVLGLSNQSTQLSTNPISGFSIIKAKDKQAALELLKTCPHIINGGTLEVSEIVKMG